MSASVKLSLDCWRRFNNESLSRRQSRLWYTRYLRSVEPSLESGCRFPDRWPDEIDMPMTISPVPFQQLYCAPEIFVRTGSDEDWESVEPMLSYNSRSDVVLFNHQEREWRGFDIELRRNDERLHRLRVAGSVQPAGTVSTFLERIEGSEVDARVTSALQLRLVRWANGTADVVFNDRESSADWSAIIYAVVFDVDVVADGEVIGRGAGTVQRSGRAWKTWQECGIQWVEGGLERVSVDPGAVELIGRASPKRAGLLYIDYPFDKPSASCWMGEIRVPAAAERW